MSVSLPLSPLVPNPNEDIWEGLDLNALGQVDPPPQLEIGDILSLVPPVLVQAIQEDERAREFELFLKEEVVCILRGQLPRKDELQKLLLKTQNLVSPEKLQFLRDLATQLLSSKESFSCQFEAPPYFLPSPFSLHWMPNKPVLITVKNPALLALLQNQILSSPHQPFYDDLMQHVIIELVKFWLESLVTIAIDQRQKIYEYRVSLGSMLLIFFSDHVIRAKQYNPDRDFSQLFLKLASQFSFSEVDPRLDTRSVPITFPLLDTLVLSRTLTAFLRVANVKFDCIGLVFAYVARLLIYGVIRPETMLSEHILYSVFETLAFLLGREMEFKQKTTVTCLVYDAVEVISKKNPQFAKVILQIPYFDKIRQGDALAVPKEYSKYLASKEHIFRLNAKFVSYLLRDLYVSSNVDWKKMQISQAEYEKLRLSMMPKQNDPLAEQLVSRLGTPGNHIIELHPADLEKSIQKLLQDTLIPGMYASWQSTKTKTDKRTFVSQYTIFLDSFCKREGPYWYVDSVASALLGLVAQMDLEELQLALQGVNPFFYPQSPFKRALCVPREKVVSHLIAKPDNLRWLQGMCRRLLPLVNRTKTYGIILSQVLENMLWAAYSPEQLTCALHHFSQPLTLDATETEHKFVEVVVRGCLTYLQYIPEKPLLRISDTVMMHMMHFPATVKVFPDRKKLAQFLSLPASKKIAAYSICLTVPEASQNVVGQSPVSKIPLFGLPNKGNTCFINAALQGLFSQKMFQERVKRAVAEKHKPLQEAITSLMAQKEVDASINQVITILFQTVADIKNQQKKFHDATPVLEELLEVFQYPLKHQVTCEGLEELSHLKSVKTNPLYVLQVPLAQGNTLQGLLDKVLTAKEEVRDKNNVWKATDEKGNEVPVDKYQITHSLQEPLPDMLVMQLKRSESNSTPVALSEPLRIGSSHYKLSACIHFDARFKHYTANVLKDGRWYHCNDTRVAEIKQPNADTAYILFLQKMS